MINKTSLQPKYSGGDVVTFKFSNNTNEEYSGIVVDSRVSRAGNIVVYEIRSMNHSMCNYSIGESCILKKIS